MDGTSHTTDETESQRASRLRVVWLGAGPADPLGAGPATAATGDSGAAARSASGAATPSTASARSTPTTRSSTAGTQALSRGPPASRVRENMQRVADSFAAALAADLMTADDFR